MFVMRRVSLFYVVCSNALSQVEIRWPVTQWYGDTLTKWHSDQVTQWPSDHITDSTDHIIQDTKHGPVGQQIIDHVFYYHFFSISSHGSFSESARCCRHYMLNMLYIITCYINACQMSCILTCYIYVMYNMLLLPYY